MALTRHRVTASVVTIPLGDGRTAVAYKGQEIYIDRAVAGKLALSQLEELKGKERDKIDGPPRILAPEPEPVAPIMPEEQDASAKRSHAQQLRWARHRHGKGEATDEDLALLRAEGDLDEEDAHAREDEVAQEWAPPADAEDDAKES